jgi:hypothetical protein
VSLEGRKRERQEGRSAPPPRRRFDRAFEEPAS